MRAYFKRIQGKDDTFDGGLAWIDRQGKARVSTNQGAPGPLADVSDRSYFATASAHRPAVRQRRTDLAHDPSPGHRDRRADARRER